LQNRKPLEKAREKNMDLGGEGTRRVTGKKWSLCTGWVRIAKKVNRGGT